MRLHFTVEEFEKRLKTAPNGFAETIISMKQTTVIENLIQKYYLNRESLGDVTHEITLAMLGFVPMAELTQNLSETLHIPVEDAKIIYADLDSEIFSRFRGYINSLQMKIATAEREKEQLEFLGRKKDSLSHQDILGEIENPTPSISVVGPTTNTAMVGGPSNEGTGAPVKEEVVFEKPATAPTLQDAVGNIPTLGGFKPAQTAEHPAQAIADKLDQKLSSQSAGAPREIYQVKKTDPYHEPLE